MKKIFKKLTKKTILAVLAIIVIGVPLLYLTVLNQKETHAWFDENWLYRAAVPITAHTNAEANVYITVTVDTATPITAGKMQSDCGDLRFIKANGEALPYYINGSPGCNNAATTIQVNFDDFPAGAQTIYYYYGNPSAPNGFSSAAFSTEATGATIGTIGSETQGPGPVGYWSFDDGQGTVAQDKSSSNNDGTLSGSPLPTWQTEDRCVSGKCLYFNNGGYTAHSKVGTLEGANNYTLSAWVRSSSSAAIQGIIGQFDVGGHITAMQIDNSTGYVTFTTYEGGYSNVTSTTAVNDGKWHHLVVTKSGTTGSIYVDGVFKTSGTVANVTATTEIRVGTRENGAYPTIGFIDEPKVYNYARTAAQVKTDYLAGKANASAHSGTSAALGSKPQDWLSNGLVGYWKMDEASGDASDSSGNSNTATNTNTATYTAGKFGNAGTFNGSTQYFTRSDDSDFDFNASTGMTVAIWVKGTNGSNASKGVFTKRDTGPGAGWMLHTDSSERMTFAVEDTGGNEVSNQGTTDIADGNWHHIVGTLNRATNTLTLFVDGVQQDSASTSAVSDIGSSRFLSIGVNNGPDGGTYWAGSLDEARIYNRAFSPKEVSDLYNWAPGPVGYWDFEEGNGTSAKDKSTNANTGTLGGDGSGTDIPTWKPGKYGKGLSFDGSDDYVQASDTNLPLGSSDRTISFWTYARAISPNGYLVKYGTNTSSNFLSIYINSSKLSTSQWGDLLQDSSNFPLNSWQYVTLTISGSSYTLYRNGIQVAQKTMTTATTSSGALQIGGFTIDGVYFNGLIDEVKVYNYARTQKQIVSDMNAGHPAVGSPVGSAIGHWKFDEGYGQTANNSGSGGSTLNGTLGANSGSSTDDPSWSQSGKFGKALSFDGGDFVDVGNNTAVRITGDMSISFWVNPSNLSSTRDYVIKNGGAPNRSYGVQTQSDSTVRFYVSNDGTGLITRDSSTTLSTSTWYHITAIYNASSNMDIYINGVLRNGTLTGSIPSSIYDTSGVNLQLGSSANGIMDDVKLYNYALTADEVKLEYNRGSSMVLGTLGSNSSYQPQAANQEYCIPGDTASCAAPVGRWDFEEKTGTSANDSSGNGNTGTLGGDGSGTDLPTWKSGKIGGALQFDGSNDYIDAGSGSSLDMTGDTTVEFWMNRPSASANRIIDSSDGGWTKGWLVGMDGGYRVFYITAQAGAYQQSFAKASALSLGVWQHVAIVRSGSTATFYVNGVNQTETSATHINPVAATSNNALIGNGIDGNPFNGSLDGVRVFNYARSAAQVAWDYNRGGPVGHWKLDECQGASAKDSSGNGNHGAITIGASGEDTLGTCTTSSTAWGSGATGKRNASLSFDGTDDSVSITSSGTVLENLPQFSASAWVKPSSTTGYQSPFGKTNYGSGAWLLRSSQNGNGNFTPHVYTSEWYTCSGGSVPTDSWTHLTITYDGETLKGYLNGKLSCSNETPSGNLSSNATSVKMGTDVDGYFYSGQVDDARVYNYALTATQVKDVMNQGAVFFGPATGSP